MEASISLRRALSARFFLLALAYLLFMLGGIVFWLVPRLQAIVVHSNESMATALAVQAEKYLVAPQRALTLVVERIARRAAKDVSLSALLDVQVGSSDIFEAVYVLDAHGKITHLAFSSDNTGKEISPRSRDSYMGLDLSRGLLLSEARRKGQGERLLWSSVFLSAVTGRLAVAVAMPAGDSTVIGEVGLANLSEYVRRIDAAEGVTVMIIDSHGQILAHPDVNVASQQLNVSNLSLLQNANGAALQTEKARFQGVEVIATRAPIAGIDWAVLVTQPLSTAREPVVTILTVLGVAGLLVAILSIWLGGFFSARLSAIFEKLVGTAEAVAVGHYPTVWQSSRVAEFARLIDSLHRMSLAVQERESELSKSHDELMAFNQSLEQRVVERTNNLMSINAELHETLEQLSHTQEELQRTDRLAALGALVAGIAHELNTPIGNSLVVASTCAMKQVEFEAQMAKGLKRSSLVILLKENRGAMEMIQLNLQRSAELIASFKQVAVDQTTTQRRQFSLRNSVNEIVLMVTPSIKASDCKVRVEVPENITMDSYPGPLSQVLTNLINNAVIHGYEGHAQPGTGEITISARIDEQEVIELVVSDHGAGIPPEHLKRVFDPFFTTAMSRGGTGLGLSIVYNVINDLLGGNIRVESEPGQGCRFIIRIPSCAPVMNSGVCDPAR